MERYVDRGDAKQVIAQLADGTTWLADVEVDGRLKLIRMLDDPGDKGELPEEPTPEEQEINEAIDKAIEEVYADWSETEAPAEEVPMDNSEEVQQLIEKMSSTFDREKKDAADKRKIYKPIPDKVKENLKDPAFKARLSSIMKDNAFDRRTKGRTRGKLDMTRLYKVPTGSRSVFTQKQSMRGKHYSVVLLVDTSGSMSGTPARLAAESAVFMVKQLEELGIKVGVITFSSSIHVLKELGSKPNYDYIYSEIASASGGNCDYQGMRRAYHMLSKAEGKKVMLMLSDGEPTGFYNNPTFDEFGKKEDVLPDLPLDRDWETRESFHHLVKSQKDVDSYGIGIMEGGWQVPDHEVIHNVDDLKRTIIKAMRRFITRG